MPRKFAQASVWPSKPSASLHPIVGPASQQKNCLVLPRIPGQAVKWIGRYLKGTANKGLILRPSRTSLDLFVDADFAGNWDPSIAGGEHSTAQSRHGFVLMFCGMPIVHASQLQSLICLSTTETEYVGLSKAIQETIPVVRLLQEMKDRGYPVPTTEARVHCRVFEDNVAALEIAKVPKMRPRTRHLNCVYHHFRNEVANKRLLLEPISSEDQQSDILTKCCNLSTHVRHRRKIMGW